jgi:hypothetical protein
MDEFGRIRLFSLIPLLAGHPREALRLVRLGRNFEAARNTLRIVARRAGDGFEISALTGHSPSGNRSKL